MVKLFCFFLNLQSNFQEPRLLVVTDPLADYQAVKEAARASIPVIALCNTNSPLRFVDIAIPTNNRGRYAIGLAWWFLAREVLRIRGCLSRAVPWNVMVDSFFVTSAFGDAVSIHMYTYNK